MKLDPARIDRALLTELLGSRILAWFRDREDGDYLGVTPTARREILQLPRPLGLSVLMEAEA